MSAMFPTVPVAPGVPPVRRPPGVSVAAVIGLAGDALSVINMLTGPKWGIFDASNNPVLVGTSVEGVDFRHGSAVCTYPVEDGSFRSYNKVMRPWEARVTIAHDGSATYAENGLLGLAIGAVAGPYLAPSMRTDFLTALEAAVNSLALYSVVTPEFTYRSANVTHYDYRRQTHGGTSMIIADIGVEEIRVAPSPQFSQANTASTSAADPLSGGTPSPSAPTPAQTPPAVGPGGTLIGGA